MNPNETSSITALSKQLAKSNRVIVVKSLSEIVSTIKKDSASDISLNEPCNEIFYNHHKDNNSEIYFMINLSDKPVEREISFRAAGKTEKWDLLSGEIQTVHGITAKNKTIIPTKLKPFESVIYVFNRN
jgi:hypothetical protein